MPLGKLCTVTIPEIDVTVGSCAAEQPMGLGNCA
jgi:hypothetical protein